jgi:hypothetical protein
MARDSDNDQPASLPKRKHEKRRVSLDGQDPIEVLKRLLENREARGGVGSDNSVRPPS